jgi:nitrate reductase gamma subunit
VLRISRTPAHLRWELYPMPKGTREQQKYGGSYFEETEWWKKCPPESRVSEALYILREVFGFATLRTRNRPLWLWSWLMHMGLYLFVAGLTMALFSAITGHRLTRVIWWTAAIASCVGIVGVVGIIARRASTPLRGLSTRSAWLNLILIGALFFSALMTLFTGTGEALIAFAHALLRMGPAPELGFWPSVHLAIGGVFLAYFPVTHLTHAYMKFFLYHQVRWDDAAVVHDPSIANAMAANVARPISWAAPHIANGATSTWAEVVARSNNKEVCL